MAKWIVEAETLADIVNGRWTGGKKIVRCKNCVFWKEHDGFGKCINPASNIASDVWLNPLFYCRAGVEKMTAMQKEK